MLKHAILGLLNYGDMTGYEIMTAFRDSLSYFWSANTSQIYRELQWLKTNGYAIDRTVPQDGKPDKNLFSITPEGRDELHRWLAEEDWEKPVNLPMLMKMFFAGENTPQESCMQLEGILIQCRERLAQLPQLVEKSAVYRKNVQDPQKIRYWDMTMDFKRRYEQMVLAWCEDCIRALEKGAE